MESWQKEVINTNRQTLTELVDLNGTLLPYLQSYNILSNSDVEYIQSRRTQIDQSKLLYDLLITRIGAFDGLLLALNRTNQSGAAQILDDAKKEWESGFREQMLTDPDDKKSKTDSKHKEILIPNAKKTTFVKGVKLLSDYIDNKIAELIFISTIDTKLTVSKIQDTVVHKQLLMEPFSSILKQMKSYSGFIWWKNFPDVKNDKNSILVLYDDENSGQNCIEAWTDKLSNIILKYVERKLCKKAIVVLSEDINRIHTMTNKLSKNITVLEDAFCWEDLNSMVQLNIMKQNVSDQGRLVKLEKLCKYYVYEKDNYFMDTILKDKLLVDLIRNEKPPVIFKQTIPPVRGNYVPRTVRTRYCISKHIFQSEVTNDIYLFSGEVSLEGLSKIAGNYKESIDTAESQLSNQNINVRFLLLQFEKTFDKFLHKFGNSYIIHRFKLTHEITEQHDMNINQDHKVTTPKIIWESSAGKNMGVIQSYLCDDSEQKEYNEDEMVGKLKLRLVPFPVIICDSPGMGKSMLLANLANKLQQQLPDSSIVIYLVMKDFIAEIQKKMTVHDAADDDNKLDRIVQDQVAVYSSAYSVRGDFFQKSLTATESIWNLFFDGLDEVPATTIPLALKCLARVKQIFKSARLVLTTRPHLLTRVECSFKTLGYNIKPFDENDQIKFLTDYWSQHLTVDDLKVNTKLLNIYTKQCLSSLKGALGKKECDIAGIPLQCLLIGEVYEEEGKMYADPNNKQLAYDPKPTFQINSIAELYNKMMERKFSSFENRLLRPEGITLKQDSLWNLHVYLSIQAVFPEISWTVKMHGILLSPPKIYEELKYMFPDWMATKQEFEKDSFPREQILILGIVEAVENGNIQFVHRTFAEYFLGKFSAQYLSKAGLDAEFEPIIQFIDEGILETNTADVDSQHTNLPLHNFKFPVICHFINSILTSTDAFCTSQVVQKSKNYRNILFACATDDYRKLFQLYCYNFDLKNTEFFTTLVSYIAQWGCPNMLDLIDYQQKEFKNIQTILLKIVAQRGSLPMFVHLWNKFEFRLHFENWNEAKRRDLLHLLVKNTLNLRTEMVKEKCEILDVLETSYPGIILNSTRGNLVSIFLSSINVKMLIKFLNYIDITDLTNEINYDNETILHILPTYLSCDDYTNFLDELRQKCQNVLERLFQCRDMYGQTPLHSLVRYNEPNEKLFDIFSQFHADFDSVDNRGYSVLWTAIETGKSPKCLTTLMTYITKREGEYSKKDKFDRKAIHIAAQHAADENILKLFISSPKHVDVKDCFGNTPIFYGLRNSRCDDIIWFLHKHKANLNHKNNNNETILHLAAEQGNSKITSLLFRICSSLDQLPDIKGNNPLHYAMRSSTGNKLETLEILMTKFAFDIDKQNNDGHCPLMHGLKRRNSDISLEMMEYIVPFIQKWTNDLVDLTCKYIDGKVNNKLLEDDLPRYEKLKGIILNKRQ